jgi:hypothetical protein
MQRNSIKWTPHSERDHEIVREELERILSSPQFRNSKRYPDFLRYVVDQALHGAIDQIKERTIGIEVFGRAPDYDTSTDTIVRYTAGEVRKRLSLYYSEAPDTPLQITLAARSYHPEFCKVVEPDGNSLSENAENAEHRLSEHQGSAAEIGAASVDSWPIKRKIVACLACVCLGIALAWIGQWAWARHRAEAADRFWSPVTQTGQPVLIAPGGVMISPASKIGTEIATGASEDPFLSFESALALGRITALLRSREREYQILPSASVTLAQMRGNSVVLIGAYNNAWTERLLTPLRFHFVSHPGEAIVDTWHPEKRWVRDWSKPFTEAPDYGLVARFHDPSTDGIVVVVAGLQRYGTDAASEFAASSHFLDLLNRQIGSNWKDKNLEVVIRVDVVNGRAGAPITEAIHTW